MVLGQLTVIKQEYQKKSYETNQTPYHLPRHVIHAMFDADANRGALQHHKTGAENKRDTSDQDQIYIF
jgi:hypothetical protein